MRPFLPFLLPVLLAAQSTYLAETRTVHNTATGLPADDVLSVTIAADGTLWATTATGLAKATSGVWTPATPQGREATLVATAPNGQLWFTTPTALWNQSRRVATLPAPANHLSPASPFLVSTNAGLFRLSANTLLPEPGVPRANFRQSALARDGRLAAASDAGLFLRTAAGPWQRLFPQSGSRSWAPLDVRGVAFDSLDRLWFASPQGVGRLDGTTWTLWTGADGLPFNDFTTLTPASDGSLWFGTRRGAIRFDGQTWEYRQGLRWLPGDHVRSIAAGPSGDVWLATPQGLSHLERRPTTLAEKARFFESEIDRRHRRTPYGYVLEVSLPKPGDTSSWTQHDSDNDGLWTAMYGAGECFATAAGVPGARPRALAAFEALRFLGTVTQGGPHPAPPGFVARSIRPASGPDPNLSDSPERDRQMRATRDRLWKDLSPRWPLSADGQWYWKADTSSDELDGHYFFYALYYDLVAQTDSEKQAVRNHVAALTDHLLDHNFQLIDHDGKPTRWGVFDPETLNHNPNFHVERGMNSLSMLSYLKVAAHITGNPRYQRAYLDLIRNHAYDQNVLIPKAAGGPGAGNQSDDEMIFMNYYGLLRYETDPALRRKYLFAFRNQWILEEPELNPFFNYLYAATATGETWSDAFDTLDLTPAGSWREDSLDTLRRFPLDRISWGFTNSHRTDLVRLPAWARESENSPLGHRANGKVLPIDERFVEHWNHDPWRLDQNANGRSLADGAAFLLPYYLGLHLGYIPK